MILVTGCARSGTSLTVDVLRACGANIAGPRVNKLNEALDVRDGLVKPWLKARGYDPLCQDVLPVPGEYALDAAWRDKVLTALQAPAEPWAYKGAKMCLMWDQWHAAFPEARWVLVRRSREKIVESCLRTSFMTRRNNAEAWGAWHDVHVARMEEMKAAATCLEVWPGAEPEAFRPVVEWLGLSFDAEAVAGVFKPGRWHG